MILYLSGPMSGYPNDNFAAFHVAAAKLRDIGYTVLNPAEGSQPSANGKKSFTDTAEYGRILQKAVGLMCQADGLAMLPGWEGSNGACLEVELAGKFGMTVRTVDEWLERHPVAREQGVLSSVGGGHGVGGTLTAETFNAVVEEAEKEFGLEPGHLTRAAEPATRCLKWVGEPHCAPQRHHRGDAGYDLIVEYDTNIWPGKFVDVSLGISVELPPGTWGMLTGRSSALRKRGILVSTGIIDNGYRGELFAGCQNLSEEKVALKKGERVAQLILMPLTVPLVSRVSALTTTDRGSAGFGSTGA
jgi:dUTP pyrophosphatase